MTNRDKLEGCEGYQVVYPGGHLGFVDLVLRDEHGELAAVAVLLGLSGARITIVPVDEIAAVDPSARRVNLFDAPEPGSPERFAEVLCSQGHEPID